MYLPKPPLKKIIILSVTVLVLSIMVLPSISKTGKVSALTGSDFNPAHIIDDVIFTNSTAMSASDIQNFLNAQLPNCDTNGSISKSYYYNSSTGEVNNSNTGTYVTTTRAVYGQRYDSYNNTTIAAAPYVCLKDYVENPSTGQNNLQNPTASISGGISAAQIIYNAAQKYSINPEVLLVTLQKEQGLVTDDWPWTYEYTEAMGFNCPDTPNGAACSGYAGLYQQVNAAAQQYRNYLNNPTSFNYIAGTSNKIYYNVTSSCSSYSNVNIYNNATAALYDYTPYQPNAGVLAATNPTGSSSGPGGSTGDACASYGNRNFWWYFNTWFGSSLAPSFSWQPMAQAVYSDSSKSTALGWGATLTSNASAWAVVKAKNTGNFTWTNTGNNRIDLGASSPNDRSSAFCTSGWLGCGARAARLEEASVAPGDTGTFEFPVTAPTTPGNYIEHFNLVAEGLSWFNDPGQSFDFNVIPQQFSWQVAKQAVYTDATQSTSLGGTSATLTTGQNAYLVVLAANTGNYNWTQSGLTAVELGTDMNRDRPSPFANSQWPAYNRAALLQEPVVGPGQWGTFYIPITAPATPGTYNEAFNLVGNNWFSDPGMHFTITVKPKIFSWQPLSQSIYTDSTKTTSLGWGATLSEGQSAYAVVTAKNTSNFTWSNTGSNPINLGASNPNDRSSPFCTSGWIGCGSRAATMVESSVAPGQTATFQFPIKAPTNPGSYNEHFNLVAEGLSWFDNPGQSFQITVN